MDKKDINDIALYSLFQLIKKSWGAVLCGKPTLSQEKLYNEMKDFKVGDFVCESTNGFRAIRAWEGGNREGAINLLKLMMGVLDEIVYEEYEMTDEEKKDYTDNGEEIPKQKIYYIYNMEGVRFRWHNADFLRVPSIN